MRAKATSHLRNIYPHLGETDLEELANRVFAAAGIDPAMRLPEAAQLPGADEVVLITYGNTLLGASDGDHLQALSDFRRTHLDEVFSTVHVLPFYPASSDGGFAVIDYRTVATELGDWRDIAELAGTGSLMVDLVCNHGSAASEWFLQFQRGEAPGSDYYLTVDPGADLAMVTRPRTHALLRPTMTPTGEQHVWATFSHDQVDFDFSNPDVLVEFCAILGFYLSQGADRVRLDAIAYLWKQIGTTCIHLPETHHIVKLMRLVTQARNPQALIITETNVPHRENVSYFGDSDEAHVVYNFTLAPLIVWSLVTSNADTITDWLDGLESPPPGCTFLNFLASHDGLGLRPVEDLIAADELTPMIDEAVLVGGDYSAYATVSGPRPYELNVSLADLLAGPTGENVERYLTAHALMMAVQGIPAIYLHSMLASPGDVEAVVATGAKRSINRSRLPVAQVVDSISTGWRAEVFARMSDLIRTRRSFPAFDPTAAQQILRLHPDAVVVQRGSGAGTVMAVHNMANQPIELRLPPEFGETGDLVDLISNEPVSSALSLGPWQACWVAKAS